MIPIQSVALNKTLSKGTDGSTCQIFHELLGRGMKTLKLFCLFLANAHEDRTETNLFVTRVWDGEGRISHYLQGLQILSFVTLSKNSP